MDFDKLCKQMADIANSNELISLSVEGARELLDAQPDGIGDELANALDHAQGNATTENKPQYILIRVG